MNNGGSAVPVILYAKCVNQTCLAQLCYIIIDACVWHTFRPHLFCSSIAGKLCALIVYPDCEAAALIS